MALGKEDGNFVEFLELLSLLLALLLRLGAVGHNSLLLFSFIPSSPSHSFASSNSIPVAYTPSTPSGAMGSLL